MKKYNIKIEDIGEFQGGFVTIRLLLECLIQYEADNSKKWKKAKKEEIEDLKWNLREAETPAELMDIFNNIDFVKSKIIFINSEELEFPTYEGWDSASKAVDNFRRFGIFTNFQV